MSNDQFQELQEQIAVGFAKQDEKIGNLDKKIGNLDEKNGELDKKSGELSKLITKLYQHFEERFNRLDDTKADRDQVVKLQDTMDGIAARLATDEQERSVTNHQLDRHEDWIERASKRVGVSYKR